MARNKQVCKDYYQKHKEEILKRRKELYKNNDEFREKALEKRKIYNFNNQRDYYERKIVKEGDLIKFIFNQRSLNLLYCKDKSFDETIENELLLNAQYDHNIDLLDDKILYKRFLNNIKFGLIYGNLQVLKYFVYKMVLKIHNNKKLSKHDIEMIKYYENTKDFETIKSNRKHPINYINSMPFAPADDLKNEKKTKIYALLYNFIMPFRVNVRNNKIDIKEKLSELL